MPERYGMYTEFCPIENGMERYRVFGRLTLCFATTDYESLILRNRPESKFRSTNGSRSNSKHVVSITFASVFDSATLCGFPEKCILWSNRNKLWSPKSDSF